MGEVCATCGHGASERTLRAVTNKPKRTTKPPTPMKKKAKVQSLAAKYLQRYKTED
jgi:hypothetical protein